MSNTVDPRTLKPGDRVRVTTSSTGVVTRVSGDDVSFDGGKWWVNLDDTDVYRREWVLVERPLPEVGSLWTDPGTGTMYAATRSGRWPFVSLEAGFDNVRLSVQSDVIDRLVRFETTS